MPSSEESSYRPDSPVLTARLVAIEYLSSVYRGGHVHVVRFKRVLAQDRVPATSKICPRFICCGASG